jgi:hypothetical protein
MKSTKKTQPLVPSMETDLSRINQLSQAHDDENWDFRSWLKQNEVENIAAIVHALSPEILRSDRLQGMRGLLPIPTL